jgi:hypothetical protein
VVDALNKRAHKVDVVAISIYMTDLKYKIISTTNSDQYYLKVKEILQQGNYQQKINSYEMKEDGVLMYKGKIYVSNVNDIKNVVLKEMNNVLYAKHQGYYKTIKFVRSQYFWPGMKKQVANYIVRCLECKMVKTKHRHPIGF